MKPINLLIPFLLLLLMTACARRKYNYTIVDQLPKDSSFEQIDLKNATGEDVELSSLVKKISYIKLETKENCLIGNIDKIQLFNDKIYICDETKSIAVFVFDKQGHFLFKLARGIGAPGEFTNLSDFVVNERDSCIYILSRNQNMLLKYSPTGKFIHNIHIPPYIDNFQALNDGSFLLYREFCSIKGDPLSNSRLMVLQPDGRIKIGWFTKAINTNIAVSIPDPIVSSIAGTYSISRPFENTIYSFSPGNQTTKIKYYIDFGNNDLIQLASLKSFPELNQFQQAHSFLAGNVIDKSNYLYFMFFDRQQAKFYFKNRKNAVPRATVIKRLINDIDFIPNYPFLYGTDSSLVSILPSYQLKELYDASNKQQDGSKKGLDTLYKYGAITQETDNPLIAVYTLQ